MPKKAGFTVVKNDKKELVQTRLPTKIRVCIDSRKLNSATCKDHFPLPFIDQMVENWLDTSTIISFMDIQNTTKFSLLPKTKRKQLLLIPLERLHTVGCHLDYKTILQHSNIACSALLGHGGKFFEDIYGLLFNLQRFL